MTRRRKSLLVVLAVLVLGAGGFTWYWQATAVDRQVHALLDELREEEPGGIQGWLINLGLMKDRRTERGYREVGADVTKLGPSAVPALIRALRDEDREVRLAATATLGRLGDLRAVDPLIGVLKDEDGAVRLTAVLGLRSLQDPRRVEPLITALKDDDSQVRSCAATVLGVLGDPRAVDPLIAALRDEDRFVKRSAVWALGKLGDARGVEALNELLDDEKADVRRAVKEALEKLRRKHAGE